MLHNSLTFLALFLNDKKKLFLAYIECRLGKGGGVSGIPPPKKNIKHKFI